MGTNFYLFTNDRDKRMQWFGEISTTDCLTDSPDFGYKIHIAKTSGGWQPLFEAHCRIRSVRDIKSAVTAGFKIFDEYSMMWLRIQTTLWTISEPWGLGKKPLMRWRY